MTRNKFVADKQKGNEGEVIALKSKEMEPLVPFGYKAIHVLDQKPVNHEDTPYIISYELQTRYGIDIVIIPVDQNGDIIYDQNGDIIAVCPIDVKWRCQDQGLQDFIVELDQIEGDKLECHNGKLIPRKKYRMWNNNKSQILFFLNYEGEHMGTVTMEDFINAFNEGYFDNDISWDKLEYNHEYPRNCFRNKRTIAIPWDKLIDRLWKYTDKKYDQYKKQKENMTSLPTNKIEVALREEPVYATVECEVVKNGNSGEKKSICIPVGKKIELVIIDQLSEEERKDFEEWHKALNRHSA